MKVGDYVRTYYGISKIKRIIPMTNLGNNNILQIETEDVLFNGYEGFGYFDINEVKSSPNIIDLIEVGDYVNGFKVIDIVENDIYISDYYAESYIGVVKVKDIKSIVTKEQFSSMEYKVGE